MQHMIRSLILIACAFAILSGCASGPELDKYPRRQIERPYTLPDGVAAWTLTAGWQHSSIQQNDPMVAQYTDTSSSAVLNSTWQQSLSDDWTLLWLPIPLGVMHQFTKTESDMVGATFAMGFAYSSLNGFDLRPTLSLQERHYFSKNLALDITPSFSPRIPFQEGQSFDWAAGVSVAPFLQLTDALAFQPGLTLGAVRQSSPKYGLIASNDVLTANANQFVLPLFAQLSWNLSRQWDLKASYSYSSIGYKDDYKNHTGALSTVFYW
jgi:opacity protein-like surface antigen